MDCCRIPHTVCSSTRVRARARLSSNKHNLCDTPCPCDRPPDYFTAGDAEGTFISGNTNHIMGIGNILSRFLLFRLFSWFSFARLLKAKPIF